MATYNTPIIPASEKDAANAYWENAGITGDTFSVGLVPASGPSDATITHYFGSGQLEKYFPTAYTEFPVQFPNAVLLRYVGNSAGNYEYVEEQLALLNLKRYNPNT
jgi:hypothetical protein